MRSLRFEHWFAQYCDLDLDYVHDMWDGSTYTSSRWHVEVAWAAWCAALNL